MSGKTLVAGLGNIFFGDDGFGVEVAQRLAAEEPLEGVRVADIGIRGVHLAYEMLEDYDTTILIDTVHRGEPPGTIYVIEHEPDVGVAPAVDAHGMTPDAVLALLETLGGRPGRVLVVGCEPADVDERIGLSETVAGTVPEAVKVVKELLNELWTSEDDIRPRVSTGRDGSRGEPAEKAGRGFGGTVEAACPPEGSPVRRAGIPLGRPVGEGREKGVRMKKLLLGGLGVVLVYAAIQNIPELARYLKIRSM